MLFQRESVAEMRIAIKNSGGKEYSKALIQQGEFIPKAGDIIIFKSDGATHVDIVSYYQCGTIYYIDGNDTSNGNGYNSCVHNSCCSAYYSKSTCVLRPNYFKKITVITVQYLVTPSGSIEHIVCKDGKSLLEWVYYA